MSQFSTSQHTTVASIPSFDAFAIASGIDPLKLKIVASIILVALLLFAYSWATNNGYKLIVKDLDLFGFLKLVLGGAALLLCIVYFFIY